MDRSDVRQDLDINPQIYCGYSRDFSDCGAGLAATATWKKDGDASGYRLGGSVDKYRGNTVSRVELNIEEEVLDSDQIKSKTQITSDNPLSADRPLLDSMKIQWVLEGRF